MRHTADSCDCRIIEWFGKGTSEFQPTCHGQEHLALDQDIVQVVPSADQPRQEMLSAVFQFFVSLRQAMLE